MKPATQENLEAFYAQLTKEYECLFKTPKYEYVAARTTPEALARKMTLGLDQGNADKDGEGIKATCKHFGIAYTYKAIRQFLSEK